jgi:hypothetical protein
MLDTPGVDEVVEEHATTRSAANSEAPRVDAIFMKRVASQRACRSKHERAFREVPGGSGAKLRALGRDAREASWRTATRLTVTGSTRLRGSIDSGSRDGETGKMR